MNARPRPAVPGGAFPVAHTLTVTDRLAGHTTTRTTEIVYRHQLRPILDKGVLAMDQLFSHTA